MDLIIIFFTAELVELKVRFKITTCGILSNSAAFIKLKNDLKNTLVETICGLRQRF